MRGRAAAGLWRLRASAARGGMVRPAGAPQAFAAGRRVLHVLLAGSGPVVGWGVGSHDLALPGALARALAATTGRGVIVDVMAQPSAGVRRLRRILRSRRLPRYDVVVLSAAVEDAVRFVPPARWAHRVGALLHSTRQHSSAVIAWLGAPPIRGFDARHARAQEAIRAHADRLNFVARLECRDAGALFVPLADPPHVDAARHRSPADYLFWARTLADALAPALEERPPAPAPVQWHSADRAEAIDRLRLSERTNDPRLSGLVGTAKRTLGTEIAMFTVLDDRREWALAASGAARLEFPIEQSVCLYTVQTSDGMAVCDAQLDERFAGSPLASGPAALRYYAGYPVEAPDGTRIGAVCVFSRKPRSQQEAEADLDVLRELALLAQRELWQWQPGGGDS